MIQLLNVFELLEYFNRGQEKHPSYENISFKPILKEDSRIELLKELIKLPLSIPYGFVKLVQDLELLFFTKDGHENPKTFHRLINAVRLVVSLHPGLYDYFYKFLQLNRTDETLYLGETVSDVGKYNKLQPIGNHDALIEKLKELFPDAKIPELILLAPTLVGNEPSSRDIPTNGTLQKEETTTLLTELNAGIQAELTPPEKQSVDLSTLQMDSPDFRNF